ncbi:MAG: CHAT domain-containing protein [Elainellaceae cyanobacterium]
MLRLPRLLRRVALSLFALGLTLTLLLGQLSAAQDADAQDASVQDASSLSAREQVQQGVTQYQTGDTQSAIALWEAALATYQDGGIQDGGTQDNQAIVLENLARAHQRLGEADQALSYWRQVVQLQAQLGDRQKLGRMLTEQAQTHTRLGQYRQAVGLLCGANEEPCRQGSAVEMAQGLGDREGEAAALGSLGEAYRLQGKYDEAAARLEESLALAEDSDATAYVAAATNSLGNIYVQLSRVSDRRATDALQRGDAAEDLQNTAISQNQTALRYFEDSLTAAQSAQDKLRARLSLIPVYHRAGELAAAQGSYRQAVALLDQVTASRAKAYAAIDLANLLPLTQTLDASRGTLLGTSCLPAQRSLQAEALLLQAIATAKATGDYRAQSFAYGKLGHLYECDRDYSKALSLTQDAEWAADQALQSRDSLYLWQWQTGRIFKAQQQADSAIAAYEAATTTLEKIRGDILVADRDVQFDFRDAVEPVYRELATLRLGRAPTDEMVTPQNDVAARNIGAALTAIDSLKLAELQNYFGDECIILASIDAEAAKDAARASYPNTAIFSTFVTDSRTAVVLTLPKGRRRVEWLPIDEATLNQEVNAFRIGLEESLYSLEGYDLAQATALYNRLISPFTKDLEEAGVETLVFVQDGIFRSIPMAALYDGDQYLIQRYAIATTPSLSLTSLTPAPRRQLRALALGLSESATVGNQEFASLRGVDRELAQIKVRLPGSRSLLNDAFTLTSLQDELQENDYAIIHMATHGEFGAEPEDTFLVTGDKQKLTIGQLEAALRQTGGTRQIDLLTLTACKTAIGDTRATLGLAGVAVQAGARSAIASLWSIDDLSTAVMVDDFYAALSDANLTKAKALQTAQVAAIERGDRQSRPGFWAPFLLIGDWQ